MCQKMALHPPGPARHQRRHETDHCDVNGVYSDGESATYYELQTE